MKPTARMTGKDYHNSYDELKRNEKSLDVHVRQRLMDISVIHPEAVFGQVGDCDMRAKSITRQWVDFLTVPEVIEYIEKIEKWSSDNSNIKQLEI